MKICSEIFIADQFNFITTILSFFSCCILLFFDYLALQVPVIKYHHILLPETTCKARAWLYFYCIYKLKNLKTNYILQPPTLKFLIFFLTCKPVYSRNHIKPLPLAHSHILKLRRLLEKVILWNGDLTLIQRSTIYVNFASHSVLSIGDNGKIYSITST